MEPPPSKKARRLAGPATLPSPPAQARLSNGTTSCTTAGTFKSNNGSSKQVYQFPLQQAPQHVSSMQQQQQQQQQHHVQQQQQQHHAQQQQLHVQQLQQQFVHVQQQQQPQQVRKRSLPLPGAYYPPQVLQPQQLKLQQLTQQHFQQQKQHIQQHPLPQQHQQAQQAPWQLQPHQQPAQRQLQNHRSPVQAPQPQVIQLKQQQQNLKRVSQQQQVFQSRLAQPQASNMRPLAPAQSKKIENLTLPSDQEHLHHPGIAASNNVSPHWAMLPVSLAMPLHAVSPLTAAAYGSPISRMGAKRVPGPDEWRTSNGNSPALTSMNFMPTALVPGATTARPGFLPPPSFGGSYPLPPRPGSSNTSPVPCTSPVPSRSSHGVPTSSSDHNAEKSSARALAIESRRTKLREVAAFYQGECRVYCQKILALQRELQQELAERKKKESGNQVAGLVVL